MNVYSFLGEDHWYNETACIKWSTSISSTVILGPKSFGDFATFGTMGKGPSNRVKKSLTSIKKDLPFRVDDQTPTSLPRNMRAKQRALIMAGLRHLGAPVEAWRD